MQDQTPGTWQDGVTALSDQTFNTEIRNAYLLLLNPPSCSVRRASNQSIPNGASWTAVSFDTLLFDTEDPATPMYAGGNPTRITITTPGWYECVASAEITVPGQLTFTAAFRVNGVTIYHGSSVVTNPTLGSLDVSPSNLIAFSASDYVELVMTHNYASAITVAQSFYMPAMQISRRRGL